MNSTQLAELFKNIRSHRGWLAKLRSKTDHLKEGGFHRNHFYNVLSGHRTDNHGIILIAAKLLLQLEKEKQRELEKTAKKFTREMEKFEKIKEAS